MTSVWLILRKDLTVLRRSPLLLGALLAYPIVIALLVGLVAGYASSKPRIAFVDEDGIPPVVTVGGHHFHIQTVIDDVAKQVTLVRMGADEAARELSSGKVVATITVPPGFLSDLVTTVHPPSLELRTGSGGLAPRVTQQVQALVYQLNGKLQAGYIAANLQYVRLILHGGDASFIGRHFKVLGLDRMDQQLDGLPQTQRVATIRRFVHIARLALAQTGGALQATANPIQLAQPKVKGRTWVLSAQVQSYGIAITVTFLALLLAAGAAAAERDEGTIGRLRRGLASLGQLVWAKSALAAVVGLALGGSLALVFGVVVEIGGVTGGEPWARLPLLLACVLLAAGVAGTVGTLLGALAREARTASLLAVLVVLPVVFLGLVPRGAVPLAWWVSDFLPFAHAARLFGAALYDTSPWHAVGIEVAWLVGLGAAFGVLARLSMRRLAA
ncbi:MAG TPA: ABC transporter permease [Gaiellaceae bacterium]|nr:ABC transporter permease [Gaiellaceae bacterium]